MKVKSPKLVKFAVSNSNPHIKALKRGSIVKVSTGKESFWVVVNSRTGNSFTGEVNNMLVATPLKLGEVIAFKTKNIMDISPEVLKESKRKIMRLAMSVL